MTEPRLPIRGEGNGRAHGIPSEMFTPPPRPPKSRLFNGREIATGVVLLLAAAVVSAAMSFFVQSQQAAAQVRETTSRVIEVRTDLAELRRKQVEADIAAARLAGNYEAVVKGVDQRLQQMQNQLDRIERQR